MKINKNLYFIRSLWPIINVPIWGSMAVGTVKGRHFLTFEEIGRVSGSGAHLESEMHRAGSVSLHFDSAN